MQSTQAPLLDSARFEGLGHLHQVGKCFGLHLFHRMPAMDLDGDFAQPDLSSDLLIHQARDRQGHDLLFSGCQRLKTRAQLA